MAHIKRMTDKPRTKPWRAHIHRKGHKPIVKMFALKEDAQRWAAEQERHLDLAGLPLTNAQLKKVTVGDIVFRYMHEITPQKASAQTEFMVLSRFASSWMGNRSLAFVSKQDGYAYIDSRLREMFRGETVRPSTVRREINSIQRVFEEARERWGYSNLINPFRGISIKGSMYRRKRRLQKGEMEKLEAACKRCLGLNRYYVPLAIFLGVETGMRLQEIFNLAWLDIDFENRLIEIRKSKTDHLSEFEGRTIVLSYWARSYLTQLKLALQDQERFIETARIFPMTKDAFKQSWADVVRRAGITDITFHDLRREAGSRFDEAGLTKAEHDLMLGHSNRDMASLYIRSNLAVIRDKLDRFSLGGFTADEVPKKLPILSPETVIKMREMLARDGYLTLEENGPTAIPLFPSIPLAKLSR